MEPTAGSREYDIWTDEYLDTRGKDEGKEDDEQVDDKRNASSAVVPLALDDLNFLTDLLNKAGPFILVGKQAAVVGLVSEPVTKPSAEPVAEVAPEVEVEPVAELTPEFEVEPVNAFVPACSLCAP
jgi:hypothetical protein